MIPLPVRGSGITEGSKLIIIEAFLPPGVSISFRLCGDAPDYLATSTVGGFSWRRSATCEALVGQSKSPWPTNSYTAAGLIGAQRSQNHPRVWFALRTDGLRICLYLGSREEGSPRKVSTSCLYPFCSTLSRTSLGFMSYHRVDEIS